MNPLRAAIGVLGLALLGVVVWAALAGGDLHGTLAQQFAVISTLPWGVASLFDLYAGFVLFGVIILMTERSWVMAGLWAAPMLLLGNIWAAVWLVVRFPRLVERLTRAD